MVESKLKNSIMDINQYLEIGGVVGLFALFIVQYFNSQKLKKDPLNGTGKLILTELQTQNNNHLEHLQSSMDIGFKNMIDKQDDCTVRICEKLDSLIMAIGELKGMLRR